jgi:hypothetical protein
VIRVIRQNQNKYDVFQIRNFIFSQKKEKIEFFYQALDLIITGKVSSLTQLLNYAISQELYSGTDQPLLPREHEALKKLYQSESSYFGPNIPKPFQILIGALFIKLQPSNAFRKEDPLHGHPRFQGILEDFQFNYDAFCFWIRECHHDVNFVDDILKNLKKHYFMDNISLKKRAFSSVTLFKIEGQNIFCSKIN